MTLAWSRSPLSGKAGENWRALVLHSRVNTLAVISPLGRITSRNQVKPANFVVSVRDNDMCHRSSILDLSRTSHPTHNADCRRAYRFGQLKFERSPRDNIAPRTY